MTSARHEGRRRLGLVLGALSGGLCAALMGLVLVFYGPPVNPVWWAVMAAILVAATVAPRLLAPAFEWVLAGYRDRS